MWSDLAKAERTAEQEAKPITSLTILLNFFDELQRRMPGGT